MISKILKEEEDGNLPELHHEDTASFEKAFCKDRDSLIASILEYGNPFKEAEQTFVHITSRHVLDDLTTKSVKEAKRIGQDQYIAFINERLINRRTSLYDTLKRNDLSLFWQKHLLKMSKSNQKIATLNSERRLYANLYVPCQSREGDLDNFFAHKNHVFPVSISEQGKLRKATSKSDFLQCMESLVDVTYDAPGILMKVIDGVAFVNMNRPKSYGKYCENELVSKLKFTSQNTKRLGLVFDVYNENSHKSQTRENRGGGMRISVRKDTLICKDFQKFMRNDTNKTELFKMIAEAVIQILETLATIVATTGSKIASNSSLEKLNIKPCNHEEADTILFLHVLDGANSGIKKVSTITVDKDVVVIALQHFFTLNLEEL